MLGIVVLIVGAVLAATFAAFNQGQGAFLQAVFATVVQLIVAGAAMLRLPGARLAAVAILTVQLLFFMLVAFILMLFVALPFEGGGPLPGHPLNPVALAVIVVVMIGALVFYFMAGRSAWRLRPATNPR